MKKYFLPILIMLAGLAISCSAAYYSVLGLAKLFAGAYLPVVVMASSLELSKLVIASLLYTYRKTLPKLLKTYLTIAVVVLIGITSMGIYGYLTSAYQTTMNQTEVVDSQLELLISKKTSYDEQLRLYNDEKESLTQDMTVLRSGLSNNKIQYLDSKGNVITTTSSATRKSLEKQIDQSLERQNSIISKIDELKEKTFEIDEQINEVKTNAASSGELGPLKYLSGLTGYGMDKIINILLLTIIFVFDPLAISLIISANFAFSQISENKKKTLIEDEKIYEVYQEPITPSPPPPKPEPLTQIPPRDLQLLQNPNVSTWRKNKIRKKYIGE
jgi:hypothetical protein